MASLPPTRQQSQPRHRPSSPDQSSTSNQQPPSQASAPSPIRTRSEDSQTLFLNSPDSSDDQQQQQQSQQAQHQDQQRPTHPPPIQRSDTSLTAGGSPKKCWICFADSTEDTPETSPWRDPCPCALVAHEECLLDWIADMEAPNNRRSRIAGTISAPKIECPQCKSEIKLARPKDYVVEGVRALERLCGKAMTPAALTLVAAVAYNGSFAHGVHSTYAVFGAEDGLRILRPIIRNAIRPPIEFGQGTLRAIGDMILNSTLNHLVHWRLYVGLPLITPMLILSRTSLADSVLPVLPILFFATQTHDPNDIVDFGQWPPSASLSFAILPYIRSLYNVYYKRVWAERERKWLKEIQPRVREGEANQDGAENAGADAAAEQQQRDDGNIFEVRIDGGIWEDWSDDDDEEEENVEAVRQAEQQQQQQQQNPQQNAAPTAQPSQRHQPQATQVQQLGEQEDSTAEEGQRPEEAPAEAQPGRTDQAGGGAENSRPNIGPTNDILDRREDEAVEAYRELEAAEQENAREDAQANGAQQQQAGQAQAHAHNHNHAHAPGERRLSFSPTAIMETVLGALAFPAIAGISGEVLKQVLPRYLTTKPSSGGARGLLQEKWGRSLIGGCAFVVLKDAVMLYVRWRMADSHRRRRVLDFEGERTRGRDAAAAAAAN